MSTRTLEKIKNIMGYILIVLLLLFYSVWFTIYPVAVFFTSLFLLYLSHLNILYLTENNKRKERKRNHVKDIV